MSAGFTGCIFGGSNSAKPPECGDGTWHPFEECDPGEAVYGAWCNSECTWNVCGDGELGPDEACETPGEGDCADNCQIASCGNGAFESGVWCLGEALVLDAGDTPTDVAFADVDGDGDTDILVGTTGGPGIKVWFNDNGTFTRSDSIDVGGNVVAVASAEQDVFALRAVADIPHMAEAYWNGAGHDVYDAPFSQAATVKPGTLHVTRSSPVASYWVASTTDAGIWMGWFDDPSDPRYEIGQDIRAPEDGIAAMVVDKGSNLYSSFWFADPDEPRLLGFDSLNDREIAAPGLVLELFKGPDGALPEDIAIVGRTAEHMVAWGDGDGLGEELTRLAIPEADTARMGWLTESTGTQFEPAAAADLDALVLTSAGFSLVDSEGVTTAGPAVPDLVDVELRDLNDDGLTDVVGVRAVSNELYVWFASP